MTAGRLAPSGEGFHDTLLVAGGDDYVGLGRCRPCALRSLCPREG